MQSSTNDPNRYTLHARLSQFDGAHELAHQTYGVNEQGATEIVTQFAGATWQITVVRTLTPDRDDAVDCEAVFRVVEGAADEVAVAIERHFDGWSRDNFVMMPAAAYNGNRYTCRAYTYPPMVHELRDIGPDAPVLITDVPRLNNIDGAPSRLQVLSGDATTPCISAYAPHDGIAFILLTDQGSRLGNHGLTVEESADRAHATWRIEAPGMRRDTMYTMATTDAPSWDRSPKWRAGDEVAIRFRLFAFPAHATQDLYDRFAAVRKDLSGDVQLHHELPFSAAWDIVEDKYQRDNWNERGYYMVGTRDVAGEQRYQDWQVGPTVHWVPDSVPVDHSNSGLQERDPYVVLGFTVNYQPMDNLQLWLRGENLTDARYASMSVAIAKVASQNSPTQMPGVGRSVSTGISYRF